jgi:hypothetical protein
LEKLAREINAAQLCKYEVAKLRDFAEHGVIAPVDHTKWWQQGEVIIGGLVVSVSLGAVIGLALGKR